ncbi:MAG: MBL fold metallo-hydrolase [Candidatus Magasanikbacteria bacterium]
MHIQWLGASAFKLQVKPVTDEIVVAIDPYKQEKGNFPRSLTPHIGIATHGIDELITLSGDPFIVSIPGEYETKNVLIQAVAGKDEQNLAIRVDAEMISFGHFGLTKEMPTDAQIEFLTGVDILAIPVGGKNSYSAEQAIKLINNIEPRIVIPYAYKSDNEPDADSVEVFLKEIGVPAEKPGTKVIIKKKDLPQEDMQIIVLEKE